jgi:hypothetical protein
MGRTTWLRRKAGPEIVLFDAENRSGDSPTVLFLTLAHAQRASSSTYYTLIPASKRTVMLTTLIVLNRFLTSLPTKDSMGVHEHILGPSKL